MAFITEDQLRNLPGRFTSSQRIHTKSAAASRTAATITTVFLSHSHDDEDLVEPTILLLASQGVLVYVDWKDPTMPALTSPETAARIKERIGGCKKFVVLGTNNAVRSRWIPWELGIADSRNGLGSIAIMPVEPQYRNWEGHEYIGIYSRLETADDGRWAVFPPGKNRGAYLEDWLKQ
jgi:hypothetical protein